MRLFLPLILLSIATPEIAAAQCQAGIGGSAYFAKHPNHRIVYAIRQQGERLTLEGAAVLRAPSAWFRQSVSPPVDRKPSGAEIRGSGATVGPVSIRYESDSAQFWVDSVAMPMAGANVLLLEVGPDEIARRVGSARIDASLPGRWSCGAPSPDDRRRLGEAVLDVVSWSEETRDFLEASRGPYLPVRDIATAYGWLRPRDTLRVWSREPSLDGDKAALRRIAGDTMQLTSVPGFVGRSRPLLVTGPSVTRLDVLQRVPRSMDRRLGYTFARGLIGAAAGTLVGALIGSGSTDDADSSENERALRAGIFGAMGFVIGGTVGLVHGGMTSGSPRAVWRPVYEAGTRK
ncbi:MAG TPA: hypothetical protein VFO55_14635 [Gemmatimonadaceae bacterium]|nr:hypothetical protein [Gemmatimonadaceae bacterium]